MHREPQRSRRDPEPGATDYWRGNTRQWRCLLVVFHQPRIEAFLVIVGAMLEVQYAAIGAFPVSGDRLGDVFTELTAITTGRPRHDSCHRRVVAHIYGDNRIQRFAVALQKI